MWWVCRPGQLAVISPAFSSPGGSAQHWEAFSSRRLRLWGKHLSSFCQGTPISQGYFVRISELFPALRDDWRQIPSLSWCFTLSVSESVQISCIILATHPSCFLNALPDPLHFSCLSSRFLDFRISFILDLGAIINQFRYPLINPCPTWEKLSTFRPGSAETRLDRNSGR